MIEVSIDTEADAMYVFAQPVGTKVKRSDCDVADNVIVDIGVDGKVVGIEFLAIHERNLDSNVSAVLDKYLTYSHESPLDTYVGFILRNLSFIKWKLK